jgi:hypothetical protein
MQICSRPQAPMPDAPIPAANPAKAGAAKEVAGQQAKIIEITQRRAEKARMDARLH